MKKRAWVKWVAAVFFAAMLLLTFFSGTIRNRSLPKVWTQCVTSGTITPEVSGGGIVEASEKHEITAHFGGTVTARFREWGDTVSEGDALLTVVYEDDGSLEAKRQELQEKEQSYTQAVLLASVSSGSADDAERQMLQNRLNAAQEKRARCIEYLQKRGVLDGEQTQARGVLSSETDAYNDAVGPAQKELEDARQAVGDAKLRQENAQANESYYGGIDKTSPEYLAAKEELDASNENLLTCQNRLYAAQTTLTALQRQYQPRVDSAQRSVDDIEGQITALEAEYAGCTDLQVCDDEVLSAQMAWNAFCDSVAAGEAADEAQAMQLAAQKEELDRLRRETEELEQELEEQTIRAPADGVITGLLTGDTFDAGTALVQLEGCDRYTLRFPVDAADTALLDLGMEAAPAERGKGNVTARLVAIQPDEFDPGSQGWLVFNLFGSGVRAGQYLSLRITMGSSTHETVVPNAAIQQDARGTFVYVVDTKNTPLGTRASVRRVSVEIVRSDGRYTAVEGELTTEDYVVIQAEGELTNGQAVRFGE